MYAPGWFFRMYRDHGPAFASWLRKNGWLQRKLRPHIRRWMDQKIEQTKAKALADKAITDGRRWINGKIAEMNAKGSAGFAGTLRALPKDGRTTRVSGETRTTRNPQPATCNP